MFLENKLAAQTKRWPKLADQEQAPCYGYAKARE